MPCSCLTRSSTPSNERRRRSGSASSETQVWTPPSDGGRHLHLDAVRRPAANRLLEQLPDDRVERHLRRLAELLRLVDLEVDPQPVRRARPGRRAPSGPGAKPWSRRTTGSSANDRSRSSRIVARCRSSAVRRTLSASSSLPVWIACIVASSISAMPERFCTGPSCRKSAIRRRSSCSAAIRRSSPSSTGRLTV